jgi:hypothetical protein
MYVQEMLDFTPRPRRATLYSVAVALLLSVTGVVIVAIACLLFSRAWSWADFLYDLGLGVFAATGVAAVLGVYMEQNIRREEEREEARRAEIELVLNRLEKNGMDAQALTLRSKGS